MMGPYLDAANVDLKSFSEDFYKNRVGGRLKPVLNNIREMFNYGIWLEVTTLLIPGLNDSYEELENIAKFLSGISPFLPWHISAYYPQYKSDIGPTHVKSIIKAIEIGKKAGFDIPMVGIRQLDRNRRMMPAGSSVDKTSQIQQRMHEEFVIGFYKP